MEKWTGCNTTTTRVLLRPCCTHRLFDIGHEHCVVTLPQEQKHQRGREYIGPAVTLEDGVYKSQSRYYRHSRKLVGL